MTFAETAAGTTHQDRFY